MSKCTFQGHKTIIEEKPRNITHQTNSECLNQSLIPAWTRLGPARPQLVSSFLIYIPPPERSDKANQFLKKICPVKGNVFCSITIKIGTFQRRTFYGPIKLSQETNLSWPELGSAHPQLIQHKEEVSKGANKTHTGNKIILFTADICAVTTITYYKSKIYTRNYPNIT